MASLTPINPSDVPEPIASYAQALTVSGATELVYVSGQIPQRPDGTIPDGFPDQCRLVWSNVLACLRDAGLGVGDLVKVTTFLTDRAYTADNRAIRLEVLGGHLPTSTVVVAGTLDPRWLLEMEAVAAR